MISPIFSRSLPLPPLATISIHDIKIIHYSPIATGRAGVGPILPAEVVPPRVVFVNEIDRHRRISIPIRPPLLFHYDVLHVTSQTAVAARAHGTFLAESRWTVRLEAACRQRAIPIVAAESRIRNILVGNVRELEFVPVSHPRVARRAAEADQSPPSPPRNGRGRRSLDHPTPIPPQGGGDHRIASGAAVALVVGAGWTVLSIVAIVRCVVPRRAAEEVIRILRRREEGGEEEE